jgi:voltage-gated potassium channel
MIKFLPTQLAIFLKNKPDRRNLMLLFRFLGVLLILIAGFTVVFQFLMLAEGQRYSWVTGVYWTLTVMSTLGFGDITFESDIGRIFSVVVLLSGMVSLLVVLPFTFIEFFYAPWMQAHSAARAPRVLAEWISGHSVLTRFGPVDAALIRRLQQYHYPYVLLVQELEEALRLHDLGLNVVVGDLDDPETYRRVRVDQAALVATTLSDTLNTNVAFTVREISATVPIVATAASPASVDILELAAATESGMAKLVVPCSFLGIVQYLVGFRRFLEPGGGRFVPRIAVRVIFDRQLAIGAGNLSR